MNQLCCIMHHTNLPWAPRRAPSTATQSTVKMPLAANHTSRWCFFCRRQYLPSHVHVLTGASAHHHHTMTCTRHHPPTSHVTEVVPVLRLHTHGTSLLMTMPAADQQQVLQASNLPCQPARATCLSAWVAAGTTVQPSCCSLVARLCFASLCALLDCRLLSRSHVSLRLQVLLQELHARCKGLLLGLGGSGVGEVAAQREAMGHVCSTKGITYRCQQQQQDYTVALRDEQPQHQLGAHAQQLVPNCPSTAFIHPFAAAAKRWHKGGHCALCPTLLSTPGSSS